MISTKQAQDLMNGGGVVIAADGSTIGAIGTVFLDAVTGDPTWVSARGRGGDGNGPVVPLAAASVVGVDVTVAFDRQQIADAPRVAGDGYLVPSGERTLRDYYRLGERGQSVLGAGVDGAGVPSFEDDDDAGVMIRSEEQVHVSTEVVEAGRVRLRKYIVTEDVTVTVQVSREEMRLERVPGGDLADASALPGVKLEGQVVEMTLHAQRPVVTMETVAVERVRVSTHVVTEQVEVANQVRRGQIEADTSATGENGSLL